MQELAIAARWRLRAEEYRTIADALSSAWGRDTYERMADTCERIAELSDAPSSRLTEPECRALAEECREMSVRFESADARRKLMDIAQQWDRLAGPRQPN